MNFSTIKGHLAMAGANIMWGLMAPVVKTVMGAGVITSLLMTDFRVFGAAVLFWITSLFVPYQKVPAADLLRLAGAAMLGILFNQGCYVAGVRLTAPGDASIITTTMPLWVMLLAALLLGEPITLKKAGGIALGACGALLLVLGGTHSGIAGDNPTAGNLLVLAAQVSYALYLTFYRNFIRKYSVVTLMKWMFFFASIPLLAVSWRDFARLAYTPLTRTEIAGIAYVVVCATFIAYVLVMIGQKNLRPTLVGMYNYVQPIVATTAGIIMGLDRITPAKLLAVVLIFCGVWLVTVSKAAKKEKATPVDR